MNYMVHVHHHESWGLTFNQHIFNQTYYSLHNHLIIFTTTFLFPVQSKFHVDCNC